MLFLYTTFLNIYANKTLQNGEYFGPQADAIVSGAEHIWVKQDNIIPTYIKFRPGKGFAEEVFFLHISKIFQLPGNYGFKFLRQEVDATGMLHKRYLLTVNNIPVFSGMFVLHTYMGKVESYNGYIFNRVDVNTTPTLSENDALAKATSHIGAELYKWQMPIEEKFIKREQNNPNATFYPKGELIIVQKGNGNTSTDFHLCWKYDIYAHQPMSRHDVYVDAQSGEIIKTTDRICHVDATGTATTVYRGVRTITTDYTGSTYRLREAGRGNGIRTYNMLRGTTYGSAVDFTDADNNWNNVNPQLDQYAPDAHWAAEKTYDFYLGQGRNSIDDAGYLLNLYVHYDVNYVNAFWDGTRMTFGDGDASYDPLVSLDITGHEITHGLTTNTSNLDYSYESGALNESFSDIFGASVEYFADIPGADWTIGEDIGAAFRSMSNPNSFGDPDCYMGTNYYTGTADNGGVHTNSGVQNFWFYLLVTGGSGTNDVGDVYSVTGQGRTIAQNIAWRNNVVYLVNTSDHADARFYAIQSATDLYGACSNPVIATTNAWYAVNVGDAFVAGVDAQFSNTNPVGCAVPFTVNFSNLSVNADSFIWYFGDGATSNLINPSHTYTTLGVYTVKLVSYGGACGRDSITYTNLVNINSSNPCAINIPATGAAPVQTTCTGTVYDNGGQYGPYTDNTDGSVTISPTGASRVTLTFTRFRMETNYDYLRVYDGPSTASPLLGSYTGTTLPASISSTGGSITIRQQTDPSVVDTGFAINWTCTSASTAPTANFVADITNTCNGKVKFTDRSLGSVTSWAWTFGDGGTSTLQNPTHVYTTNGTYTVTLTATNSFGSNTYTRTSYIVVNRPVGPAVVNGSRCGPGTVSLSATTTNNVNWYSTATDTVLLSTANPFTTPSISTTRSYYVEQAIPQTPYNVGPASNAFGTGSNFNGDRNWGLKFQVLKPCKLNSVYVYAQGTGYRTIQLRDTSGGLITSRYINVPNGGSRISLNFDLAPGHYILGVQDSMNMYRNNTGASYPYNDAGGFVSIYDNNLPSTTSGKAGYYYYFYNWEIQGYDCLSRRVAVTATVNPLPTVNAGNDSTKCGGVAGSIRLGGSPTASGGTTPYAYVWSPATGLSSSTTANPNANPTVTTNYALQVTDNRGCIGRDTVRIGIGANPTANAGLDKNRCNGAAAVSIGGSPTASGGTSPYTYTWLPSTGLSSATVANPNASPGTTTTYNVKVSDAIGCFSYDTVKVTQRPNPTVNAGRDTGWCAGSSSVPVVLGGSPTASGGTSPYTYTWSPSTALSSASIANPTSTTTVGRTYALQVTDNFSCVGRDTIIISVNPLPTANAGTDKTFCDGGNTSGTLGGSPTASGTTSPYTYGWSPATYLSSTSSANPSLSGIASGTIQYVLTVTDAKGCVSYDTTTVGTSPSVTPGISITGNDTICSGQSTILTVTPSSIAYPIQWNTSATTNSITVTSGGTYTVSVPACNTTSASQVITELPFPNANFSQSSIALTTTFTDLSTGSPTRWRWNFGDGSPTNTTQNPSHTYAAAGTYTVTLVVGNGICSDSFSLNVMVDPNSISSVSNQAMFELFPNPTSDILFVHISNTNTKVVSIDVLNTLGQKVISTPIQSVSNNNTYSVDIKKLSDGVYYLQVTDSDNKISTAKFTIHK